MSKSTAIVIALAGLLLLTWITLVLRAESIEKDLVQRVGQVLSAHAVSGLEVEVRGRDLSLRGELPHELTREYLGGIVRDVWGVRSVDVTGLHQGSMVLAENDPLSPRLDAARIVRLDAQPSSRMPAVACQRTLAGLAASSQIHFAAGGASPMPRSYPVLNDLATLVHQCPDTRVVIGGHTDSAAETEFGLRLSLARAAAVGRFFELAGIRADRLQVVGHGASQPIAANDTAEGRVANRRITFDLLPIQ